MKLAPHPRLYLGPAAVERLRACPSLPVLERSATVVHDLAETCLTSTEIDYNRTTHNAHLIRARMMQTRVLSLIACFLQTGDQRYRDAAVRHIEAMGAWEYWSWITWRRNDPRPDAIFDLSYGENSATLALAYDLLHADLNETERDHFRGIARRRALQPFLAQVKPASGEPPSWFKRTDSNWNTVCAGGAGMLALAMYEELAEAAPVLELAETSVLPFMRHLEATAGGWEEGVGYWNYGMRYAFMYLLSHEAASGRPHPLMEQPATRKTLMFPLDFAPNGTAASFGDVNSWGPMPFHLAAAERLGADAALATLDTLFAQRFAPETGHWPNAAELLFLHPGHALAPTVPLEKDIVRLYPGMDWAVLADRSPHPTLCCTVRGGSTDVPHGHRDPLSFQYVVGDEALVLNPPAGGYLDTTFSPRRNELYEITPAAKNTVFINGVGITASSRVETDLLQIGDRRGVRLDGTAAMGTMRDGPAAEFCGRLFLPLGSRGLLIIDRILTPFTALAEIRLHTRARVARRGAGARLQGQREMLNVRFAATVPAVCLTAHDPLTYPVTPSTMIRWMSQALHRDMVFATLLTPGGASTRLRLTCSTDRIRVRADGPDWSETVEVSDRLLPTGALGKGSGKA